MYFITHLIVDAYHDVALFKLGKYFPLKPESVGLAKLYFDGKLSKTKLSNGVVARAISSSNYI